MPNQIKRSSTARMVSIIVVFGLVPAWFFYIGIQFSKTMQILENNQKISQIDISK
jgi:hypothetical protein